MSTKKLEMTTEEIVRSYREALDKRHQIEVLADLNVCSKDVIRRVLIDGGVKHQELPRQPKKKSPMVAAIRAEIKAHEEEGKKAIMREALAGMRERLQKEYDGFKSEWEQISAEYLGKINVINMMMEEDLK